MAATSGILYLVMVVGFGALLLVASVLAFRGRRFWATWVMLMGTILQFAGGVAVSVGGWFMMQGMHSSSAGASGAAKGASVLMMCGLAVPLGFLLFGAGLIGVCSRFGGLEKRTAELEVFNRQLQDRIQG